MLAHHRSVLAAVVLFLTSLILLQIPPAQSQAQGQAQGQAPPAGEEPSELFLETVDVDVVNVEVVVTDRDGNPIHGLTREDFVVQEDGETVEITNFYAVQEGRRLPAEGSVERGAEPEELSPLPEDQKLNLVVLIDNLNTSPTSRNRILRELETRLDEVIRPGDRVLVAAANPEVRVIQPFTEDQSAVAAALEGLELTTSRGDLLDAESRMIRREINEGAAAIGFSGAGNGSGLSGFQSGESPADQARESLDMIRSWSVDKHTQNLRLLGTLNRFIHALAGLPGRRAVLYVSEGFAVRPAEAILSEWYQAFAELAREIGVTSPESEATRWDASSELVRLTEAAAGNHVTFYTLESGSGFHDSLDPEVDMAGTTSRMSDISDEGSLSELAWRTGGIPLLNSGNVEVLLDRMASDYREYYSLGYTSPHSNDGEYHRIEVEVPGQRVRIRHTQGYRATTPDEQTMERTMSALVFDVADNPLGVRVEVGDEQPEKRGRFVLPVLVRVPISSLTLIPREAIHQGKVSVVVAIQGDEGGVSEPHRLEVPVEIPNEELLQSINLQVAKGVNLLVRKGESKLAVGVRDELSGTTSTLNLSLSVGGDG